MIYQSAKVVLGVLIVLEVLLLEVYEDNSIYS